MRAETYDALVAEIAEEFPGFRIVRKDRSRLQRTIHAVLSVITFGAQRRYLDSYQTTIGKTVYVTADWDERPVEQRYITLRHERIHLRQFRRFTLLGMAFLYLLVPLPIGLAWFRSSFEAEAYQETLRAAAEVHGVGYLKGDLREHVIRQFTSGSYGWMWPFPSRVARWYDGFVAKLEQEQA